MSSETKLSKYLADKGYTKAKIIQISGYTKKTVYTYLSGGVKPPEDFKKRVSDHLEKPISDLF